jgi:hypothetical protein
MFQKYIIVLFKNKKKKKIIKGYSTKTRAYKKYKELLDNNKISFPMLYENYEKVNYELGILTSEEKVQSTIYTIDDIGRNQIASTDNSDYVFLDLKRYHIEETIYDWQTNKKITYTNLFKKYLPKNEFKSVFTIHNKLVIQINDVFRLFSLKNDHDSKRLLDSIQNDFIDLNRSDAIFVSDVSTPQRKWIYKILEESGFDKKRLYRKKTTFSKR